MRRWLGVVLFGCLLVKVLFGSALADESPAVSESGDWVLTFFDDFDGEKLGYDRWTPKDPWGEERNNELQGYLIKAFHLKDGILSVRCENEPSFYDGKKRDYRSGLMTTERKFSQQYGRFEIRCRVPEGKGLWPAFWLLPEPKAWPPEIDVLEILGDEPDRVYFSHHWKNPATPEGKPQAQTGEFEGIDFSKEFHTFTLIWEEDELRWYVDGKLRHQSREHVPHEPMFMLVNLAVGGWAGAPNVSTRFPADFEIDYVKVWERP